MKTKVFLRLFMSAVLFPWPVLAAPLPIEGALRGSQGRHAGVELSALADPGTGPLPLSVVQEGGMTVVRGSAPEPGLWRVVARADGAAAMALDLVPLVEGATLPPLETSAARSLDVRVTDPSGKPVPGATVEIAPAASSPAVWRPAPVSSTTGADGAAQVQILSSAPLLLTVVAQGFPVERREIEAGPSPLVVRLKAGLPRTVETQDRQGKPVASVTVSMATGARLGTTDDKGRLLVAVPAGEILSLRFLAADGRWAQGSLKAAQSPGGPVVFKLEAPQELRGRVVDNQTRKPVGGALVWAEGLPATAVRTNATGDYILRVPADGGRRLRAAAAGYLEAEAAVAPAGAQRGPRQMPALSLPPASAMAGVVVDGTGKPVAGVELQAAPDDRKFSDAPRRARTGSAGTFRLPGLTPGAGYRVSALRDGFMPTRLTVAAPDRIAAATPLRIVLEMGRSAAGRVVDTAGKPVAGAEVRLLPSSTTDPRSAREITVRTLTDAAGSFRVDRLAKGPFDLRARAQGFAPTLVRGVALPPGGGTADLGTLVLERGQVLEGRIVDRSGNPVGGTKVQITPASGLAVWDLPLDGQASSPWETVTGGDGAFSFGGLRNGEDMTLRAAHSGYATRTLPGLQVPSAEPVVVELSPSTRITGTVTNERSEPVSGVNILFSTAADKDAPGRPVGAAMSDAEGRFSTGDLPPGRLSLTAVAAGYLPARLGGLSLSDGGDLSGVEVVLKEGAVIEGTVSTPDGSPAAGAHVIATEERTDAGMSGLTLVGRPETTADGDGHYRLSGVSEGPHTVLAEDSGFRPARKTFQVQAGANALDLRLEQGAEISGRTASREGPVAGVTIRLLPQDAAAAVSLPAPQVSGGDGSFRFPPVADGRYRLQAEKTGYALASPSQEIRVAGAPVTGVEIRLDRGGAVSGRIAGLAFPDLGHVRVVAISPQQQGQAGTVGYDGTYRIEGLAPGSWTVLATLQENGRRASGAVSLSQGQTEAALDLEFSAGISLSGRVERHGTPVAGALVSVEGPDGSGGDTVAGPDGRFHVEGLKPGACTATALDRQSGLRLDQKLDLDGDKEVVLTLPDGPGPAAAPHRPR